MTPRVYKYNLSQRLLYQPRNTHQGTPLIILWFDKVFGTILNNKQLFLRNGVIQKDFCEDSFLSSLRLNCQVVLMFNQQPKIC